MAASCFSVAGLRGRCDYGNGSIRIRLNEAGGLVPVFPAVVSLFSAVQLVCLLVLRRLRLPGAGLADPRCSDPSLVDVLAGQQGQLLLRPVLGPLDVDHPGWWSAHSTARARSPGAASVDCPADLHAWIDLLSRRRVCKGGSGPAPSAAARPTWRLPSTLALYEAELAAAEPVNRARPVE